MAHHLKKNIAPFFMIISALSFAFMSATIKQAEHIPFIQKVFFRNFIMVVIILPVLFLKMKTAGSVIFSGHKKNVARLLVRSVLGLLGVIFYFYSVEHLYLADSAMLNKLSAFFVMVLSAVFLGEKLKLFQVPALITAFLGAVLIIKPGFNMQLFPALIGLIAALTAACSYTIISSLQGKEDPLTIIFWFSAISTIATVVPVLVMWVSPSPSELTALVLTGVFAAAGQYFMTLAYSYGPAGETSIYNYTQIVFSAVIGFILWHEIPDNFSILGAVLIILAAVGLYLKGRKFSDV